MAINIVKSSVGKPALKFYRKFERAMLVVFIPTSLLILQQWDFANQAVALKIQLLISVGLTALIKGLGMIISDDSEAPYSDVTKTDDQNKQSETKGYSGYFKKL
jgi:hypothetical protein